MRVTIDLTPDATTEVQRLVYERGGTVADLFRTGLSLFRLHYAAEMAGETVYRTTRSEPEFYGPKEIKLP